MTQKNCPQADKLRNYALGQLEPAESDHVASHIESCRACEETAASFDGETDPLLQLLRQEPQAEKFASESDLAEAIRRGKSLSSATPTSRAEVEHPQQLREYQLLEKLGEGGMGAVFRAIHTKLDKTVAVKILPADRMRHAGAVERFEREMKAVGRLDHPNIVRASDAGQFEDTHFLVMEFVDGLDLFELVKRVGPLPVGAACEIIRQAAVGLSHAHASGMVHRDIKPHNLMVTGDGKVKILDLGLALIDESVARPREAITSSGQIMGTLDYMAPEQIEDSHHVDQRADVYSLGATLYKLLAGDAPFSDSRHSSPLKLMMALANDPPPAIGKQRDDLPNDLVSVLERIMRKKPDDRLASANKVAESLAEFCDRQELAKTVQRAGVIGSPLDDWNPSDATLSKAGLTNRKPTALALAAGVDGSVKGRPMPEASAYGSQGKSLVFRVGVVVLGVLVALVLTIILRMKTPYGEVVVKFEEGVDREQVQIEAKGNGQLKIAEKNNDWTIEVDEGTYSIRLLGGDDRLKLNKDEIEVVRDGKAFLTVQLLPLKSDTKTGSSPLDQLRREDIPPRELAAAGSGDPQNAPAEVVAVIGDSRMRHWGRVFSVDISPDGESAASLGMDGYLRVWNVTTGEEKFHRYLHIHEVAWQDHICVRYRRDGKQIVVSYSRVANNKGLQVLDAQTGESIDDVEFGTNDFRIRDLEFDPKGTRLAVGSIDGTVLMLDAQTRAQLISLNVPKPVIKVTFSPDGKILALGGTDRIQLHDADNGDLKIELKELKGNIRALTFSPDGSSIAAGDNILGLIRVWDIQSKNIIHSIVGDGSVEDLAFSPDGSRLFVAYDLPNRSLQVCDLQSGKNSYTFLKPSVLSTDRADVSCLRFRSDGRQLVTGNQDGTVRVWDATTGEPVGASRELPEPLAQVEITPDHQFVVLAARDGLVQVHNSKTWKNERTLKEPGLTKVNEMKLSPDGKLLAVNGNRRFVVWDAVTGKRRWSRHVGESGVEVAFSHDSHWLAMVDQTPALMIFEAVTGDLKQECVGESGDAGLAFSPDGQRLVVSNQANNNSSIRVIKTWTGEEVFSRTFNDSVFQFVSFSHSGDQVICAEALWRFNTLLLDAKTGVERAKVDRTQVIAMRSDLRQYLALHKRPAVSPTEPPRTLLSACDATTTKVRHQIELPGTKILDAALTDDGRYAIVVNENGLVYVLALLEQTADQTSDAPKENTSPVSKRSEK